jgi:hypothetical protein
MFDFNILLCLKWMAYMLALVGVLPFKGFVVYYLLGGFVEW